MSYFGDGNAPSGGGSNAPGDGQNAQLGGAEG